jgi:hypothetical protein
MWRRLTVLFLAFIYASLISAQTNGTLAISVTTSSAGGNYAPRNILAIWIEDNSGKFVKTLLAYANSRKSHLNTWETSTTTAGSVYNTTDAVTSATQGTHGTRTCQWNGTDYKGKLMADADYRVRMELTDKNATGNIASFTFTKGPNAQKLTPANVPSFSAVSLNWTTSITSVDPKITESNTCVVYPNPGTGQFTVLGDNIKSVKVTDLSGKEISKSQTPVIDLMAHPKGIYLVTIKTDQETIIRKIIKE